MTRSVVVFLALGLGCIATTVVACRDTSRLLPTGGNAGAPPTGQIPVEDSRQVEPASPYLIARDGRILGAIVLPDGATPVERTAANELATYLARITGGTPTTVTSLPDDQRPIIAVGPAAARLVDPGLDLSHTRLGDEGFVLRARNGHLILSGAAQARRGTLYAVYEFLERFGGVRWWTAREETVPSRPELAVPAIDEVQVPQLIYREPFYSGMVYEDPVFSARSRVNGHFVDPKRQEPVNYGGHYQILGWCHTFYELLPPKTYFQDHPDWYGLYGGVRKHAGGQLCLTNPAMRDELIRRVLERVRADPSAGIISVSQTDYGKFCTCPDCAALEKAEGSPAGPLLNLVNAVAEAVDRDHPGFLVETLAYLETSEPPRTIRPRSNVLMRVCGYDCSWHEPLETSAIPQNVAFRRQLERWSAITPRLFIWDYVAGNQCAHQPFPNYHVIAPNLRLYARNKAVGIFAQGDTMTGQLGDLVAMRGWVMAKLMWDPQRDEAALTREFLEGYYGPAANSIAAVMAICREAVGRSQVFLHTNKPISTGAWIGLTDLNRVADHFAEAERRTAGEPALASRVRQARFSWDYVWLQRYQQLKREAAITGLPFKGPSDPAALRDDFLALAERHHLRWTGEGVPFKAVADALRMRFRKEPTVPEACKGMAAADWLDIQQDAFQVYFLGSAATFVADDAASDGMALRMDGGTSHWCLQLTQLQDLLGPGRWRCLVEARCEGPGKTATEPTAAAFGMGVYREGDKSSLPPRATGSVADTTAGGYRTYDLGVHSFDAKTTVFVAPVAGISSGVRVDRIVFVREP
jgi:hypothetical protein